ncbi:hypothetical protein [Sphingomonas sp.]|nr:hypothetical protein [Sphingomonas sp.]
MQSLKRPEWGAATQAGGTGKKARAYHDRHFGRNGRAVRTI